MPRFSLSLFLRENLRIGIGATVGDGFIALFLAHFTHDSLLSVVMGLLPGANMAILGMNLGVQSE